MRKVINVSFLTMMLLLVNSSFALDMTPPGWRGAQGSTWAQWEFGTDNRAPAPDLGNNPYGNPVVLITPVISGNWIPDVGSMQGVWPLSGKVNVEIPNNPVENISKLIQIQLTWAAECYEVIPVTVPIIGVRAIKVNGEVVSESDINLLNQESVNLGPTGVSGIGTYWYHTTYLYEIFPNPKLENILISGSILVDELVIDTICVPEPATLALLGIGGLILTIRKRIS